MVDDKGKSPAVFAGTKYYERLLEAMAETKVMNYRGEFSHWVGALRQIANWSAPFINDPGIFDELERLHTRADHLMSSRDNLLRSVGIPRLRDDIFTAERRLYSAMKDLLLKFGATQDTEWSEEDMRRGMS